jgi:proline dehydrogenase
LPKEHKIIKGVVFRLVQKRIAGPTLSSVLNEARANESRELRTTMTFLNDGVDDSGKARYNANAYMQLAKQASRLNLRADISVRLSQLGININHGTLDICLPDLLNALKNTDMRLWLEAEDGMEMEDLFRLYRKYRDEYKNIGIEIPVMYDLEVGTIKKMLRPHDLVKITYYSYHDAYVTGAEGKAAGRGARGAGKGRARAGDGVAAGTKQSYKYILEHYISKISTLLQADVTVAVLEHDEKLIEKLAGFSKEYKKSLIFEVPLGFSEKRLSKLMKMKINLSVYTPYGKDWPSYVVNRVTATHDRLRGLAERVLEQGEDGSEYGEEE